MATADKLNKQSRFILPLILFLLIIAFALRLYRLDGQSFWADEISSMFFIRSSFADVFGGGTGEPHPPLYFLLLRLWIDLVGESEFTARFLSLSFGLLTLPLVYQVGRRLAGTRVGWLAVAVAAVSPFHIFYSQEARMYSLALLLSVLSVYVLLRCLEAGSAKLWLGWALATTAALLSHYSVIFILLVEDAFLLFILVRGRTLPWKSWLLAHGAMLLFLLPWVLFNQPLSSVYKITSQGTQFWALLQQTMTYFAVGQSLYGWQAWTATGIMSLILTLGLFLQTKWEKKVFLLAYLILPIVFIYLLSIGRREFNAKYLIVAVPAFFLLAACGLSWLKDRSSLLLAGAAVAILVPSGLSLYGYHTDIWLGRDDFRGFGRYLDDQVREGDVVIFNAPWGYEFSRYYMDTASTYVGLPEDVPLDQGKTVKELERLTSQHKRIWLVRWQDYFSDPGGFIEGWLDKNSQRTESKGFAHITVRAYVTAPALTSVPPIKSPLKAELEGRVRFLGFDVDSSELASRRRFYVTLYWESLGPMDKSYNVYVHLSDSDHKIYGQKDNRPGLDTLPTDTWKKGLIIRDEYRVDIKPETPPGEYQITIGMYDPANWKALQFTNLGTDYLSLGTVIVN